MEIAGTTTNLLLQASPGAGEGQRRYRRRRRASQWEGRPGSRRQDSRRRS